MIARVGDARWDGRVSGVPGDIAAGTLVDADVVLGHAQGLAIPVTAVVEDPQSGHKLVFVQTKNAAGDEVFTSREIHLGLQSGEMVLVQSGLKAGERVAARGAIERLAPPP